MVQAHSQHVLENRRWSARSVGRFTHWTGGSRRVRKAWIRSPDSPARSKSLYRLSYPGTNVGTDTVRNVRLLLRSTLICLSVFQRNSLSPCSASLGLF